VAKRMGHEADRSHPRSNKIKNEWRYISTLPYAIMACRKTTYNTHK